MKWERTGFGVPRLGPYNPDTQPRQESRSRRLGWGDGSGRINSLQGNVWRSLWWLAWGKGKKNKRGMKQKREKERKAAVEEAGAVCGSISSSKESTGQGWTRGQGLENQTKGSSGWWQEPAEGKDGCTTPAQSWGQSCSQGERRGLHWELLSVLSSGISVPNGSPKVMETRSLTCLHPPPHPITGQSSRNAQNSQVTPKHEILATMETSSPKTTVSQSLCESREEETSLPLQPHPAEQPGAGWEHHPCWEQSTGCILGTGRAGRGVSFFKQKGFRGLFFPFSFCGFGFFFHVNRKCQ